MLMQTATAQQTYLTDAENLARAKTQIDAGDETLQPAYKQLISEADKALQAGPFSVMQKKLVPPSGDKHDYMSIGPYWWPDPAKPDGLPYIRKDGEVNPERGDDSTDATSQGKMTSAVQTLALAYYFTGNEDYAEHAARLVRVWFLDAETKMNPNLNFGQAIPGRLAGRDIGIIDTHNWPKMLDAVALLSSSAAWTETDQKGLSQWFVEYLEWLLTSEHGKSEAKKSNNHGTWYDVQVARFALFAGKPEIAKEVLEQAGPLRLAKHIEPDGSQPHELSRTKSFSYSTMNLIGLLDLAAMGEAVGVDLWNFQTDDGRSLRRALDYLAPYADSEKTWSHQQIGGLPRQNLLPLLRRGALAFNDSRYEKLIAKLPDGARSHRANLLYPGL